MPPGDFFSSIRFWEENPLDFKKVFMELSGVLLSIMYSIVRLMCPPDDGKSDMLQASCVYQYKYILMGKVANSNINNMIKDSFGIANRARLGVVTPEGMW